MKLKKAIAIVHQENDVLGYLPTVLTNLGVELEVVEINDVLPSLDDADLFFVMGSPESAHDDSLPWLAKEIKWLEAALAAGKPMMGICFGSQIIARALGGRALALDKPEIGFITVNSVDEKWQHPGPWLDFHFDTFQLPAHAELLGFTDIAPQCYRHGNCWAVQFHPEIDVEMFDSWITYWQKSKSGQQFLSESSQMVSDLRLEIAANEKTGLKNFTLMLNEFLISAGFNI